MARGLILGSGLVLTVLARTVFVQQSAQIQVNNLERRVRELGSMVDDLASAGFVYLPVWHILRAVGVKQWPKCLALVFPRRDFQFRCGTRIAIKELS